MKASIVAPLNSINSLGNILDAGATEIYFGLQGTLNSRNFSHSNIPLDGVPFVIKKCYSHGAKAVLVLNSFPDSAKSLCLQEKIIRKCSALGVDSIIVASFSVMELVKKINSRIPIHVSVMAAMPDAQSINFLADRFNVTRVIQAPDKPFSEIREFRRALNKQISLEMISFGTLSFGLQGSCHLGNFLSGVETNTGGVCSHPKFLSLRKHEKRFVLYFKDVAVGEFGCCPKSDLGSFVGFDGGELLGKEKNQGWKNTALVNKRYVCRGCYKLGEKTVRLQEYEYLNILPSCKKLAAIGVDAFKIEGRQRPPEYAVKTTRLFSDLINNGTYSSIKLKEVEKEFFPGMRPFQGGLEYG